MQELQVYFLAPGEAFATLHEACLSIEDAVSLDAKERKRKRLDSWSRWKKRQCENGEQGGALFANIRCTEELLDLVVRCMDFKFASPQATVYEVSSTVGHALVQAATFGRKAVSCPR